MEGASYENTLVNRRATATRELIKESMVPCGEKEREHTGVEVHDVIMAESLSAAEAAEIYDGTGEMIKNREEAWNACMAKTPRKARQMMYWTALELQMKMAKLAAAIAARTPLEGGVSIQERWKTDLHVHWFDALEDSPLSDEEYAQLITLMEGNSITLLEEITMRRMESIWERGAGRRYRIHKKGDMKVHSAEERQKTEKNAADYVGRVDNNAEILVRCMVLKALGSHRLEALQNTGDAKRILQERKILVVTLE